jgi:hypothetical protein
MNFGFCIDVPEKKSYKECFGFLKEKRSIISPNLGFCMTLLELDGEAKFDDYDI